MKIVQLTRVISILMLLAGGTALRAADDGLSALMNPPAPAAPPSPPQPVARADTLAQASAAIDLHPDDATVYIVRGNIYGEKMQWDDARKDYEKALTIDPHNIVAELNLAQIKFRQKQYDQARPDFLAIESDKNLGDLADYMVFLCDLFGGHESVASQELAVFNAAGENVSYYFGNVAWDLFHQDTAGARDYLKSAQTIYARHKVSLYESNLFAAGYLPLKN